MLKAIEERWADDKALADAPVLQNEDHVHTPEQYQQCKILSLHLSYAMSQVDYPAARYH